MNSTGLPIADRLANVVQMVSALRRWPLSVHVLVCQTSLQSPSHLMGETRHCIPCQPTHYSSLPPARCHLQDIHRHSCSGEPCRLTLGRLKQENLVHTPVLATTGVIQSWCWCGNRRVVNASYDADTFSPQMRTPPSNKTCRVLHSSCSASQVPRRSSVHPNTVQSKPIDCSVHQLFL